MYVQYFGHDHSAGGIDGQCYGQQHQLFQRQQRLHQYDGSWRNDSLQLCMVSFWRYFIDGQLLDGRFVFGYGHGCTWLYGYGQRHADTAHASDRKHHSYSDIMLWR